MCRVFTGVGLGFIRFTGLRVVGFGISRLGVELRLQLKLEPLILGFRPLGATN